MTWQEVSEDWRKVVDQYRAAMAEVAEVMRNARNKTRTEEE
jgi:hypothetical protein